MRFQPRSSVKHFSVFLLIQSVLLFSVAHANTRLAIGSFGLPSEKLDGDLADLIAVRLSKMPKLDLVERRELDRTFKETTLSLAGLAKAKDAVRVGVMLRADQFLLGTVALINGTNRFIVRLVDARSGAIRAINVFRDSTSLDTLAGEIAGLVSVEMERPSQEQRDFLAIGVIQNLGVNNRFRDFPAQMRGSIAANLSGKVTVLERDVISLLATEVRMNLAGLTESMGTNAPVQFGFWIVDGFYQSYEVATPEVQLKLQVEKVQGGSKSFLLRGEANEYFFAQISETIEQELKQPHASGVVIASPTRQGEIVALEARGRQLVDYEPRWNGDPLIRTLRPRTARNPDKLLNTVDEATRVYESILLLDPDNVSAKMRLAACLLFDIERYENMNIKKATPPDRAARASDYYAEVISTGDQEFAVEAQICFAQLRGGLDGVKMLRRFSNETTDAKAKESLRRYAHSMLERLEYDLPVKQIMPDLRAQLFDELRDLQQSTNKPFLVSFGGVLFAYRFYPEDRKQIIDALLPELLEKFPDLKPYILLEAVGQELNPDSALIEQFLASLKQCEENPETLKHDTSSYFTYLSTTEEDETAKRNGWVQPARFGPVADHHPPVLVIAMTLARQRAAEKGFAPPLNGTAKWNLARSYAELNQWQKAFDIYNALPGVSPIVINECHRHLGLSLESEAVPDSAWKNEDDATKVEMAYDCIGRQQWLTAAAIFDSIGHRTVDNATRGPGAWGGAFAPVLPAILANECRAKAGKPVLKDPMRFELGDTPYIHFTRDGPRYFDFEVEGGDVWMGIYSQIKRFSGPGPFAALEPTELHEVKRSTRTMATSICLSSNFIWMGTFDDGLFELDRKTGNVRHLTMKDGLLLDGISGLYLQGQTLWIAYQKKDSGAVGTLDLQTHKFSALTPNLHPEAGVNSESGFNQDRLDQEDQPPQLPISCMMEVATGEMWFGVNNKGVQSYRNSGTRWKTIKFFSTRTRLSDIAADPAHGQVLVAARDDGCIFNEKSRSGGLVIYDYGQHKQEKMQIYQGLPSNDLTAVALDGNIAWIGGRGFVAVVDVQKQKVLRVAFVSANCIKKIQLGKTYAWIQVSAGGGDYYPDYSGEAWTGIYRLERSAIER
jgi:hypothetical protein